MEICKVVVEVISPRLGAWDRNTLGSSTIACVTLGMSPGAVRRVDGV